MRHSTIPLTVDRYGKLVTRLANPPCPARRAVRATGTEGAVNTPDPRLARFLALFAGESGNGRVQDGLDRRDAAEPTGLMKFAKNLGNRQI